MTELVVPRSMPTTIAYSCRNFRAVSVWVSRFVWDIHLTRGKPR